MGRGLGELFQAEGIRTHDQEDLDQHDDGDQEPEGQIADELGAHHRYVDVQHHDHEQEQDHHGADIDQHQGDGEKFRLQEHPEPGARHEGQHQVEHRMHGIAAGDHHAGRDHRDASEDVEENFFKTHSWIQVSVF